MPWFKVSDDLPSKAETTRIPRSHRRAALGVWALAGSWSAQQLTDGHIPQHMLDELSGTPEDADWLVTAGYWITVDDGWQFVEWAPDQPLREVVIESRRKNAEKLKNWRSKNKPSNPVTPPVTDSVTNDVVTLPPSLSPSQPDPTTSNEVEEHVHPPAARSDALESEFGEFWKLYPRKQARPDALRAFKTARKATELAVIIAGLQAYKLATIGVDPSKIKMPAGWLRSERWADEQVVVPGSVTSLDSRRTARAAQEPEPCCPIHAGYPAATETEPCARCERESLRSVSF